MRDFMDPQADLDGEVKLFPYAKNLYYHPSGVLSMTIQVYDDTETQEFSFGLNATGSLKTFLDRLYEI